MPAYFITFKTWFLKLIQFVFQHTIAEFAYRVKRIKYAKNLPALAPPEQSIVDALNSEGVFVTSLENLSLPSTVQLLNATTRLLPSIPTAVSTNLIEDSYINSNAVQSCPNQIIKYYPDLFLWGLEEQLLNIAENYIRLPVTYHGVSLRREIPNGKQLGTRLWHRDGEDRRMLKIIIYLNDVSENGGPFEYMPLPLIPSYQLLRYIYLKLKFLRRGFSAFSDEKIKNILPESAWKSCLGPAGTTIFVDTRSVFHHGKMPSSERLALFFLYTSRYLMRPEICKHSFNYDPDLLLGLARKLSQRQRECILTEHKFLKE